MVEEIEKPGFSMSSSGINFEPAKPQPLSEISTESLNRLPTGIKELDYVLGGGLVFGSVILVGGEPGIGKSTLLLQIANCLAEKGKLVLLVSGEESSDQIRLRAQRIQSLREQILILPETNLLRIIEQVKEIKPQVLMIDSIQTIFHPDLPSAPGGVGQVRECAAEFFRVAKNLKIPTFLIGHVTKEGSIAGPRVLEHMVDTVLYFEGDKHYSYRIIRAVKNRFGSTNEIGVFEMTDQGLMSVGSPSNLFLNPGLDSGSGSVVLAAIEGTRPFLVELQALVVPTHLTLPRRLTSGLDYNRVCLTIAVLEKRLGLTLSSQDIYINIVGGVKIVEPAADLAVAMAVISAFREVEIPSNVVIAGEVGLGGEVRQVSYLEERLKEAQKLGFKRAVVPKQSINWSGCNLEVCQVRTLNQAIDLI
jgi:DNA repair protein RadA/Sms